MGTGASAGAASPREPRPVAARAASRKQRRSAGGAVESCEYCKKTVRVEVFAGPEQRQSNRWLCKDCHSLYQKKSLVECESCTRLVDRRLDDSRTCLRCISTRPGLARCEGCGEHRKTAVFGGGFDERLLCAACALAPDGEQMAGPDAGVSSWAPGAGSAPPRLAGDVGHLEITHSFPLPDAGVRFRSTSPVALKAATDSTSSKLLQLRPVPDDLELLPETAPPPSSPCSTRPPSAVSALSTGARSLIATPESCRRPSGVRPPSSGARSLVSSPDSCRRSIVTRPPYAGAPSTPSSPERCCTPSRRAPRSPGDPARVGGRPRPSGRTTPSPGDRRLGQETPPPLLCSASTTELLPPLLCPASTPKLVGSAPPQQPERREANPRRQWPLEPQSGRACEPPARASGRQTRGSASGLSAASAACGAACPGCGKPMVWQDCYNGEYQKFVGWRCCTVLAKGHKNMKVRDGELRQHRARCESTFANSGRWRWFCRECKMDVCGKCHPGPKLKEEDDLRLPSILSSSTCGRSGERRPSSEVAPLRRVTSTSRSTAIAIAETLPVQLRHLGGRWIKTPSRHELPRI